MDNTLSKKEYVKFMSLLGLELVIEKVIEENQTIVVYEGEGNETASSFTIVGYDEFHSGAIFDKDDKLVKGFLDSHVAYSSENCQEILKLTNR